MDLKRVENALRSKYHTWIYWSAEECPKTIIDALKIVIPEIDPASWIERIDWGGVYINGRRVLSDVPLTAPCRIEYYEPKFDLSSAHKIFPKITSNNLIYVDDDIAVIFKPEKLPSMPARDQRYYSLKQELEKMFQCPIHFASRLNLSVQGVITVSISNRMHRHLQQAFEGRNVEKQYILATENSPQWCHITSIAAIGRDRRHPALRSTSGTDLQSACTTFEVGGKNKNGLILVKAYPITGRTHQIRVHSSDLGIPIVGDNFYGGVESESLHLLSYKITFFHPFENKELTVTLPDKFHPSWLSLKVI